MTLYELLQTAPDERVIAFVGVAKNAGKTTALNAVVEDAAAQGERLGLLSIGVDGEPFDMLSGARKPSILAPEGTLVATAERAAARCTAALRIIDGTGIRSPLGEVFVYCVERAGTVLLAGVRHRADARAVSRALLGHGADRVLVDGAFDRIAVADPLWVSAVVLSTGRVVGRRPDEVADATSAWLSRWRLPLRDAAGTAPRITRGRAALSGPRGTREIALRSPIADLPVLLAAVESDDQFVAFRGALTEALLVGLAARSPSIGVVITDPTRLQCDAAALRRFARGGGRVWVEAAPRIVGLTVNPVEPGGVVGDGDALLDAVAAIAPGLAVLDVRTGRSRGQVAA